MTNPACPNKDRPIAKPANVANEFSLACAHINIHVSSVY